MAINLNQYREIGKRAAESMRSNRAYLSRFADQVSAETLTASQKAQENATQAAQRDEVKEATPTASGPTERQIAARARMYAGVGRAAYFRSVELKRGDEENILYRYESRDDGSTCGNCLEAERNSPYRFDTGPFPGQTCRGGGRCRCVREPIYDPDAYAELNA